MTNDADRSSTPRAEELTIAIGGLTLAAKVWGPQDAPPMLCLHGWLDNAASFDGVAPRLPDWRLVALDLPGHGFSAHHPAGFPYGFVDWVAVVDKVVEALGWSTLALMGHSLGAAIAAIWAGTFSERVHRLILLEGLGPLVEAPEGAPARLARALREEQIKRERTPRVHRDRGAVIERLAQSQQRLSVHAAKTLLERGLKDVEGGVTWRTDPRLRLTSRLRLSEDQVLAFLRAISCPTLLVRASSGYPFVGQDADARLRAIGDIEIADVVGSHHVHLEDPEPVAARIRAFLAR